MILTVPSNGFKVDLSMRNLNLMDAIDFRGQYMCHITAEFFDVISLEFPARSHSWESEGRMFSMPGNPNREGIGESSTSVTDRGENPGDPAFFQVIAIRPPYCIEIARQSTLGYIELERLSLGKRYKRLLTHIIGALKLIMGRILTNRGCNLASTRVSSNVY